MSFGHPKMFWLMGTVVPFLAWFLFWAWRRKQLLIAQFVQSRLLAQLTVGVSKGLQKTRIILLIVAVAFLFLAMARPQWGFAWEEARQRGRDIVVAIDTSRSMLAEDVTPNRLIRAKLAALDLLRLAKNDRLGLVAFAGTAFLQAPLTLDDDAFRQSINVLDVGIIPQGGSALADAITTSASAFKEGGENHKVLILFSDGEDHEEGAVEAARKAAESGLRIFTIGVGTPNGELLRQKDEKGALSFIKDENGNAVKSSLNEKLMQEIASAAGGFYLPLRGAATMDVLYQRGLAPLPTTEISTKMVRQLKERFQWPLALALLFLITESFLPDRKRNVRKDPVLAGSAQSSLQKAVAVLMVLLWLPGSHATTSRALREYEQGHYKDAAREYERLLRKKPDDLRLRYNLGATAYQSGQFDKALQDFTVSSTSPDLDLQERSYYNLGNTLFRMGEQEADQAKKRELWDQSTKQFESALKLNAKDGDAGFNLDVVKKKLAALPPPPQEKDKKNDQKDDKKDQKDDKDQDQKPSDKKNDQKDNKDQKQDNQQKQQQDKSKQQKDEQQKEQEKKEQQQRDAQQKKNQADQAKDKGQDKKPPESDESKEAEAADAAAAQMGQMTPQQAKQLLDAQKSEEKALIFIPEESKKARARIFKDW